MTLTTHIIIAGAVAKPFVSLHPALSLIVALASHYLFDAIPHWDYKVSGIKSDGPAQTEISSPDTLLKKGLPYMLLDLFLGTAILYVSLRPRVASEIIRFALIVIGGVLPDALQGPYYFLKLIGKERWLAPIQRFHDFSHTKIRLGAYPRFGIPFQVVIFIIFLLLL